MNLGRPRPGDLHARNLWQWIGIVLLAALVLRLALFWGNRPFPPIENDDSVYDALAWNLLQGNGFTASDGPPYEPMFVRTPGYPAFLAAVYSVTGRSPESAMLVQVILSLLTCAMVFVLARRLVGERVALLAAWLYALLPAAAQATIVLGTEANQALLVVLATLLVYRCMDEPHRLWPFVACAAVLALATMCRPDYQLLILPLMGVVWWSAGGPPRRWREPLLAVVVFAVLLTPWIARNYLTAGFTGLSTGTGHVAMSAKLEAEGLRGEALMAALEQRYGAAFRERYGRQMTYLDGALPDQDTLRKADVVAFVMSDPLAYARQSAGRAYMLWQPRSWSETFGLPGDFAKYRSHDPLRLAAKAFLLFVDALVMCAALLGLGVSVRERPRVLPLLVIFAYATAVYGLVYGSSRYRVPLLPLVAILSSLGFAAAGRWLSRNAPQARRVMTRAICVA